MDLKIKNKQIIFIFLGEGGNVFTTLLFQEKRLNQPNSKGGKTYLFCLKIILGILWRFSGEDSALSLPRTWVQSLGWEYPQQEDMATHSSILAWRIPWTEEPDRLWSVRSQRVVHD